jgi:hypothetical protein
LFGATVDRLIARIGLSVGAANSVLAALPVLSIIAYSTVDILRRAVESLRFAS